MRFIDFSELHKHDFTISDIVAMPQIWPEGKSFTYSSSGKIRPDHGIMLFVNGNVNYISEDGKNKISAEKGDIVYVPKSGCYRAEFGKATSENRSPEFSEKSDVSKNLDFLINFNLYDFDGEPLAIAEWVKVYSSDAVNLPFAELKLRFETILSCFTNAAFPTAKIKAMLYNLLCDISISLMAKQEKDSAQNALNAATEYICANYLSSDIRISSLAKMCCMSETSFRRAFEKQYGVSPKTYILKLKFAYAETLLKKGDYSVAEAARYTGFDDASYFVRIYKKYMDGKRPGSLKNSNGALT